MIRPDTEISRTDNRDDHTSNGAIGPLPKARVEKSRWPYLLIWIVPILALAAAGYYLHRFTEDRGMEIRITFADAAGLRVGQTALSVHGVQVGTVNSITLSDDQLHAVVHVLLQKKNVFIARTSTTFWIVQPDVSGGVLSGISTVTSGPYIEAMPGAGDVTTDFNGMESRPLLYGEGIRVVLHSDRLKHLQLNSPVNYRGIQVGTVQDIRFSSDTTQVNATLFIWKRFMPLLRSHSEFWSIGGTDVKGGILSGLQLQIDSVRTLIAGGVEFATPDKDAGEPAKDGEHFTLHDEAKDDWLKWEPRIELPDNDASTSGDPDAAATTGLQAAEHSK